MWRRRCRVATCNLRPHHHMHPEHPKKPPPRPLSPARQKRLDELCTLRPQQVVQGGWSCKAAGACRVAAWRSSASGRRDEGVEPFAAASPGRYSKSRLGLSAPLSTTVNRAAGRRGASRNSAMNHNGSNGQRGQRCGGIGGPAAQANIGDDNAAHAEAASQRPSTTRLKCSRRRAHELPRPSPLAACFLHPATPTANLSNRRHSICRH